MANKTIIINPESMARIYTTGESGGDKQLFTTGTFRDLFMSGAIGFSGNNHVIELEQVEAEQPEFD